MPASYKERASHYADEYTDLRDVDFLCRFIVPGETCVLEIPCGAGRISASLACLAKRLIIVDLDAGMVAATLRMLKSAGLASNALGMCADMRTITITERVDLALVPREALQLLTPVQGMRALAAIARCVAPGGAIVIDLATFSPSELCIGDPDYFDPGRLNGVWSKDWTRAVSDTANLTRYSAQYVDQRSVTLRFRYEKREVSGARQRWAASMCLHRYDLAWIRRSLPSGVSIEAVYGSYDHGNFALGSSRLIVVLRRRRV